MYGACLCIYAYLKYAIFSFESTLSLHENVYRMQFPIILAWRDYDSAFVFAHLICL